jgi:hypothetical protein
MKICTMQIISFFPIRTLLQVAQYYKHLIFSLFLYSEVWPLKKLAEYCRVAEICKTMEIYLVWKVVVDTQLMMILSSPFYSLLIL